MDVCYYEIVKSMQSPAGHQSDKQPRERSCFVTCIIAYMESKRDVVCQILDKGLEALNDPEKLKEATPAQITTAMGTLIDKWTMITSGSGDTAKEDDLSRSLRELGQELENDE